MVSKRYTSQQIQGAIAYWQEQLNLLNESKSILLDKCSDEFGENVIFSKECKFELSENNIQKLFNIFDEHFFNQKLLSLKNLKLYVGNSISLKSIILDYTNGKLVDIDQYIALYQPDQKWQFNAQIKQFELTIIKDAIFINSMSQRYSSFSYIAQALFHEMIHAYDMHFGSLLSYTIWAINNKAPIEIIDYNSHFTKEFKQKKKQFMIDTNIEILLSGNNGDFNELCRRSAENISELKETEEFKEITSKPFSKEVVDCYKGSELVHISDDGINFSFSFGIPMPK